MAVPDFQSFFLPLLELLKDGKEHTLKESRGAIAKKMGLSPEDLAERLPSGSQSRFDNRVAWAKSYFVQAKVIDSPRRGVMIITQRGQDLLAENHTKIDVGILNQFQEFKEFHNLSKSSEPVENEVEEKIVDLKTPEEILQQAYGNIRNEIMATLLEKVKANTPEFFEKLVVELLVAMGYGGSIEDAGKTIGRSGDEGIDGIIKEDRLGLDIIYIQAKKWDGTVGRPEIQKFAGALQGKRAKKGVFITTGKFSNDALDFVQIIEPKIILIDGKLLSNYMFDFNLGVSRSAVYEVKKIDGDFFNEDED